MNNNILNNQNYIVSKEIKIDLFINEHIRSDFIFLYLKLLIKTLLNKANNNNSKKLNFIYNTVIFLILSFLLISYLFLIYYYGNLADTIWWFLLFIFFFIVFSKIFSKILNSYLESNLVVLWFKNSNVSSIDKEDSNYQPIYYLDYKERIIIKYIKSIKQKK